MGTTRPTTAATWIAAAVSWVLAAAAPSPAAADDLKVVATIKPVHSLVAAVLEGIARPALLIDSQASPHSYALRPSDARALTGADVVFRISGGLEPFTVKIAATLPKSVTLVDLASAPGVALLDIRTGTTFETHDHGKAKTGGKYDHHGHDDHDDHATGGSDGHIWLDPENAKAILRHVAAVLGQHRTDLKERLEANATAAIARLDALDAELRLALAPAKEKPFVVFHDAYQYFERRYGLAAAGSITLNPEVKPSARRLAAIRAKLAGLEAACVFAEPQFSPRIIDTVIEGTRAKFGTLDPLGSAIAAGPEHYPAMMRALTEAMVGCLVR